MDDVKRSLSVIRAFDESSTSVWLTTERFATIWTMIGVLCCNVSLARFQRSKTHSNICMIVQERSKFEHVVHFYKRYLIANV
jgi:hypothetical protein